jgi:hypothetical protein
LGTGRCPDSLLQSIETHTRYAGGAGALPDVNPRVVTLRFRGLRWSVVSPYRLRRSRCALFWLESIRAAAPSGLPSAHPLFGRSLGAPLLRLRPLQGATRCGPPTPDIRSGSRRIEAGGRRRQLSWSSWPLRRISPSESTPPRLANTGYVPSTGFRTLSTASSSLGRPALFHAGSAHGVPPYRGFPSPSGPQARHLGIALLVFVPQRPEKLDNISSAEARRWGVVNAADAFGHLQGLAPSSESVLPFRCYPEVASRSPPGLLSPLQGLSRSSRARRAIPCAAPALPPANLPAATAPELRAHPAHPRAALQRFSQRARLLGFSARALPS